MTAQSYPRSPKVLLGGMAHLARFIDKVRLRHAGQIQDYNYVTTGFDKYLIEFLRFDPYEFERQVLAGLADDALLNWVYGHGRRPTAEEIRQWNERILAGAPKDDMTRQRFQNRLTEIAAKRGVSVADLPPVATWAEVIDLDEGRM